MYDALGALAEFEEYPVVPEHVCDFKCSRPTDPSDSGYGARAGRNWRDWVWQVGWAQALRSNICLSTIQVPYSRPYRA